MATEKQTQANRRNAQHSTGPRSAAGKAASSRNATTHGLTAAGFIIHEGEEEELLQFKSALRETLRPEGAIQETLFDEIVRGKWKIQRCHMAETRLFLENPNIDPLLDDENGPKLTRIQNYAKREEYSIYRAMKKLGEIQTEVHFRKQMFPWDKVTPIQETIHGVSELCSSRHVLNAVTRLKKNKANSAPSTNSAEVAFIAMMQSLAGSHPKNEANPPAAATDSATAAAEAAKTLEQNNADFRNAYRAPSEREALMAQLASQFARSASQTRKVAADDCL